MKAKPCWWSVISPRYRIGGDSWYDPPEDTCDVITVFTTTAQRAKILAIRAWRRGKIIKYTPWVVRYNDEHPMKVRAQKICPEEWT